MRTFHVPCSILIIQLWRIETTSTFTSVKKLLAHYFFCAILEHSHEKCSDWFDFKIGERTCGWNVRLTNNICDTQTEREESECAGRGHLGEVEECRGPEVSGE